MRLAVGSMIPRGAKRVAVAASGGGDSMALLDLARAACAERAVDLAAVSVNHGLRAEAADEAALVAAYCATHDIPHHILQWDGKAARGNLMAQARAARYRLIAEWARGADMACVMLGHTRDDQAETLLMALSRAAGLDGLSGMDQRFARDGMTFTRPLLAASRDDLRAYLRAQGLRWADDPSNDDPAFERVRMRKALPMLAELGITPQALATTADAARMGLGAVRLAVMRAIPQAVAFEAGDVILRLNPRDMIAPEVERRLTLAALAYVSGSSQPVRAMALAQLEAGLLSRAKHTLAGCVITRAPRGETRFTREAAAAGAPVPMDRTWDGRWRITGPDLAGAQVRALGHKGLPQCPDWRATGLPRDSLLAAPALWNGDVLISAPLAGFSNGYCAQDLRNPADFASLPLSH